MAAIDRFRHSHAVRSGLPLWSYRTRWPFLDKRVLEFCISVPSDLKVHNGYQRYLIRRALDGIVPAAVLWQIPKLPLRLDYFLRYNAQLGLARDFVQSISASDPVREIVDVDQLLKAMSPVEDVSSTTNWNAVVMVPGTIYLICFLRQFVEFRA